MNERRPRFTAFLLRHWRVPQVPLALALAGAGAFFFVKVWAYVANPAPPFAYYYDLGVNAIATQYMVKAYATWRDLSDNLGWVSFGDVPNFYFNPELAYLTLVPLAKISHDVWFTIRIAQVLQEIVAFAGAAMLYATLVKRNIWSAVAGAFYATLPATALQIRGNIDIGWAIALAPLALALSLRLASRFGAKALPLCGIILSLCGFCFAAEYLFFTSLPAYVFVVIIVLRSRRRLSSIAFAVLGLACVVGLGGYFIVPTIGGAHSFTDSAARTAVLQVGAQLDLFSESWVGLVALLPREFMISDYGQFNALPRIGALVPVTAMLWFGALGTVIAMLRSRRSRAGNAALLLGGVLLVLALGSTLPLGAELWAMLRALPGLAILRTPDRFLALPLVIVIVFAVAALQKLATRTGLIPRLLAFAVTALAIAVFLNFDFGEHWLTNEDTVAALEPGLALVNDSVAAEGGRTISYAVVRDGSEFYTPSYGVPTPTLWYFWDIASHYYADGLGGYGLFRRAAVHTVIATPDWSDNVSLPTSSEIDSDYPGTTLVAPGDGVIVKRIGNRPSLNAMRAACLNGGPGLLDAATSLDALQTLTYIAPGDDCSVDVFFDYDPGPERSGRAVAHWDAGALLPDRPALLDADYAFNVGRTFINDPWYRNSIDGDEAFSPTGARLIDSPATVNLPLGTAHVRADETLELRFAARTAGRIVVASPDGRSASIDVSPRSGLHWYVVPLRPLRGASALTVQFDTCGTTECKATPWEGIALDAISLVEGARAAAVETRPAAAALFSIAGLNAGTPHARITAQPEVLLPIASEGIFHQALSDEPYVAVAGRGRLRFRWTGASGEYLITASGRLAGAGATIAIAAPDGPANCCRSASAYNIGETTDEAPASTLTSADGAPNPKPSANGDTTSRRHRTDVLLRARLTRGASFSVTLSYPEGRRDAGASLSAVRIVPTLSQVPEVDLGAGRQSFVLDAQDVVRTFTAAHDVDFSTSRIAGRSGAFIEHHFAVPVGAQSVTLRVRSEGHGDATVRLSCNGNSAARPMVAPITYVAVSGERLRDCHTRVDWFSARADVTGLDLDFLGDRRPDARGRIWLPAGRFAIRRLQSGARIGSASGELDGRRLGNVVDLRTPGYHNLVLRQISVRDRVLAFVATHMPSRGQALAAQQVSSFDWRVRMNAPGVLEVASYSDGNWRLDPIARGAARASAIRCDLVNTCFTNVVPGVYRVHHVWPRSLCTGLLLTLFALLVAAFPLAYERFGSVVRNAPRKRRGLAVIDK